MQNQYVDLVENDVSDMAIEVVETPYVGIIFGSVKSIHDYYSSYGRQQGFAITKRSSTSGDDGNVKYVTFTCTRGGKSQSSSQNYANPALSCKIECQAKIRASRQQDGSYKLNTVMLDHNHDLSPGKARFFRCNRGINQSIQRRLEINDEAGIKLHKSFNSLVVEAGGYENLPFLEKDVRNFVDKARSLRLGPGDAEAVHKYFLRMQERNSGFFYSLDVDDDCRIRNIFWADARSRAFYEDFGDVVTFDTTYLTNRYDMPFAPFVGVNHHGQSVLFGCGLISSEDTKTFVWLFETWKACMHGMAPKAIITDQCKAMKNAIAKVFLETRHRWCLWHIMKKVPVKLSGYSKYESIRFELHNCVYDSHSKERFEEMWEAMIERYNLHDNQWLADLYEERNRWVPIFMKDTFFAGMSTTQRSESINAFFDGYVHSKTSLKQFVEQYDHALCKKIEKEKHANYQSFNSTFECITKYPLEKQFQEAYTNSKFKEFQDEMRGILYCLPTIVNEVGSISTYKVRELVFEGSSSRDTQHNFDVQFNKETCDVNCACKLFQFRGIVCRHALAVLTARTVTTLPESYILPRWRKDVKRKYMFIKSSYDDNEASISAKRVDKLCQSFYEVALIAGEHDETYEVLMVSIEKARSQVLQKIPSFANKPVNQSTELESIDHTTENVSMPTNSKLLSPIPVRCKGRPPNTRMVSKGDQAVNRIRKKKMKQTVKNATKNGNAHSIKRRDTLNTNNGGEDDMYITPSSNATVAYGSRGDYAMHHLPTAEPQWFTITPQEGIPRNIVEGTDMLHPSMLNIPQVALSGNKNMTIWMKK